MSRDLDTVKIHSIKIDDSSFERVEEFRYMEITISNRNSIPEEIKEQIKVGECLQSFGAKSFVIHNANLKRKD
jgi:hypothetical protein